MLVDEKANKKVRLTEKETAIKYPSSRRGARGRLAETLLGEVSGAYNAGVTTHTLETHRPSPAAKIERIPPRRLFITDQGGYRLVP